MITTYVALAVGLTIGVAMIALGFYLINVKQPRVSKEALGFAMLMLVVIGMVLIATTGAVENHYNFHCRG